jgi:drug/metabolite transporter (DMT)-like permease
MLATGNWVVGKGNEEAGDTKDAGLQVGLMVNIGFLVLSIPSWIYSAVAYRGRVLEDGTKAASFAAGCGLSKASGVTAVVGAGIFNACALLFLSLGFASDADAAGSIVSITAAGSIVVGLASWVLFGEHLSVRHWAGMVVALAGVVLLTLGTSADSSGTAVLFGFLALACFASANLCQKKTGIDGVMPWSSVAGMFTTQFFLSAIGYSILAIWRFDEFVSFTSAILGAFGGLLIASGAALITYALSYPGLAGVVVGIAQSNGFMVMIIQVIFDGVVPGTLAIVGATVIVLGIAIMSWPARSERVSSISASEKKPAAPDPKGAVMQHKV